MANSSLLQGAGIRQKSDSSRVVAQEWRLPALPVTTGAFLPFWRLVYRLACYR